MGKHKIKMMMREVVSRSLWHTGLWRLVDRLTPRRFTILAGHCVVDPAVNADLPSDMKITGERLEMLLRVLGRRFRFVTVGEGWRSMRAEDDERSLVALSMDDGYRDNHTALLPLLERTGARATVFLESRPLTHRRVNWSHKYFWMLQAGGLQPTDLATRLGDRMGGDLGERCQAAVAQPEGAAYRLKRILKYDVDALARDAAIHAEFLEAGGSESDLCNRIYVDLEEAQTMRDAGIELGGHTVRHEVLSTLSPTEQVREVADGRSATVELLGDEVGVSFAYPFGRRWDFDEHTVAAVRAAGFESAVTTHAGTNLRGADPMRLARWMLDETTPIHHLVAEACGGFWLFRKLGLELAE